MGVERALDLCIDVGLIHGTNAECGEYVSVGHGIIPKMKILSYVYSYTESAGSLVRVM